jgi:hypothetical protein
MLEVDALDTELQLAAIADTYLELVPARARTLRPGDAVWHPYRHLLARVRRTIPWGQGVMVKLMTMPDGEPIMGWYWQHNLLLCNAAGVEFERRTGRDTEDDLCLAQALEQGA